MPLVAIGKPEWVVPTRLTILGVLVGAGAGGAVCDVFALDAAFGPGHHPVAVEVQAFQQPVVELDTEALVVAPDVVRVVDDGLVERQVGSRIGHRPRALIDVVAVEVVVPAIDQVGADGALRAQLMGHPGDELVRIRRSHARIHCGVDPRHGRGGAERSGRSAVGIEPVEEHLQRLGRREIRSGGPGVHLRALIPEAVVGLTPGGRRRVGDLSVEHPDVVAEAQVGDPLSLAVDVVGRRESRTEGTRIPDQGAALVFGAVLVVAKTEVETEPAVEAPGVVEEP